MWRIQAALFLLMALSARGVDINRNMCYSSTDAIAPQICDDSTNFGYELEWYSVPDGELKQDAQLKFIAKVTRLPSPALAEGEEPTAEVVPIDEAFVLVCREGAVDCSPVHHFEVPTFLLHKISIEGPFEFEHTEEGIDAETYKLKSFEFASHVAERMKIVFSIKLGNDRYIAIRIDRDVTNGATQVVPLVDTARCVFEDKFELQIANAPNGGLAFSLVPGEEEVSDLEHYRISIKQYGDLRRTSSAMAVDEEEWFVGASDSLEKNHVAGNLIHSALPFTDKELGFGGPNSILGREIVLMDTRMGLSVVSQCLPMSHTTLIDEDETTNHASTSAEVENAAALVCYFKDSGSVVVLEQIPSGLVIVRFTLAVTLRAVRQPKTELVIVPANNTLVSGTLHHLQVEWHELQVGSVLTFAGEKCILSRIDQSTFIQREFPGIIPLLVKSEPALVTTASCVFSQLGQLVFFRHSVNGTVRMEYSLLAQSNVTELEFYRYGVALSPHAEANPIEFTWQVPPQTSSNSNARVVVSGAVTWKALELDRLVGRLVKADKRNFCLVRADANSLHYARIMPTPPAPTTVKAAHCAFQDLFSTSWAVALWFKQIGASEQIQVKVLVDKGGGEDQFQVRPVGTSTAALIKFTSTANLHLDTLLQDTTTTHIEELYGLELELVSTSNGSDLLWWGSCIVGIVETPETKPPTSNNDSNGTAAHATERPTTPMVETLPPVPSLPINPNPATTTSEASTIPLIMLAILAVMGCAMYFTCNKLNATDEYQAQQDIGAHDEGDRDLEQQRPSPIKERTF